MKILKWHVECTVLQVSCFIPLLLVKSSGTFYLPYAQGPVVQDSTGTLKDDWSDLLADYEHLAGCQSGLFTETNNGMAENLICTSRRK